MTNTCGRIDTDLSKNDQFYLTVKDPRKAKLNSILVYRRWGITGWWLRGVDLLFSNKEKLRTYRGSKGNIFYKLDVKDKKIKKIHVATYHEVKQCQPDDMSYLVIEN